MVRTFVRGGALVVEMEMGRAPVHVRRRNKVRCPQCREGAIGTVEILQADAEAMFDGAGAEFTGETNVWWEGQTTVYVQRGAREFPLLTCRGGHAFTHGAVAEVA